jgi:hypothetical protein
MDPELQHGLTTVQRATQLDSEGLVGQALALYDEACVAFSNVLQRMTTVSDRGTDRQRERERERLDDVALTLT